MRSGAKTENESRIADSGKQCNLKSAIHWIPYINTYIVKVQRQRPKETCLLHRTVNAIWEEEEEILTLFDKSTVAWLNSRSSEWALIAGCVNLRTRNQYTHPRASIGEEKKNCPSEKWRNGTRNGFFGCSGGRQRNARNKQLPPTPGQAKEFNHSVHSRVDGYGRDRLPARLSRIHCSGESIIWFSEIRIICLCKLDTFRVAYSTYFRTFYNGYL